MLRKRHLTTCILITLIALLASCATGGHKARDAKRFIREHNLNRLPRFDVPIEMNDRVVAWMEYFQGPGRNHFTRYLERSGRYIPLMQEILVKEGMPRDLIYVALIESGFNTQARSHASAVGPWQFIRGTGKRYDLQIDGWVDERRDPYKATLAAMQYLKDLYNEFGDWYLAMAAYNAGEGTIRKAISMTGSKNFWDMADHRRALRPETRDYVPKYIAAAIIAKMPERFGFENVNYQEPFSFDTVTAETQTDLSVIAKCVGTSEDIIVDLNPHLVGGATPPSGRSYEVRVPRGSAREFKVKYAAIPSEERIQVTRYVVHSGDTLARIAKRYGIGTRQLAASNGLSARTKKLRAGTTLIIRGAGVRYAMNEPPDEGAGSSKSKKVHIVRRGETLSKISKRYGVSTQDIMALNKIKSAKSIHTGMKLVLRGTKGQTGKMPVATAISAEASADAKTAGERNKNVAAAAAAAGSKVHKVKTGETIGTIARRYGVSTRELLSLNDLKNPKGLRAGDTIVIRETKVSMKEAAPAVPALPTASVISSTTTTPVVTNETNQTLGPPAGTPIKLEDLRPGENAIQTKSPTTSMNKKTGPDGTSYLVKNGDTLWDIARRHSVSISQIQKWNNMSDPSAVKPGMLLTIRQ